MLHQCFINQLYIGLQGPKPCQQNACQATLWIIYLHIKNVLMPYQSDFIKITFYCYEIISHLSIYDIILQRNRPSLVYLYS